MAKIPTHVIPMVVSEVLSGLTTGLLMANLCLIMEGKGTVTYYTIALFLLNQICWWITHIKISKALNHLVKRIP